MDHGANDLTTPLTKSTHVLQRECIEVAQKTGRFLEKELKALRGPEQKCSPDEDSEDQVLQNRARCALLDKQIAENGYKIESLRLCLLELHAEQTQLKKEKAGMIEQTDSLLQERDDIPSGDRQFRQVPELVLHVAEPRVLEYQFAQDLSLYRLSEAFSNLPGLMTSIRRKIPLVLVRTLEAWPNIVSKLSLRNVIALGRYPRLFQLNDDAALMQLDVHDHAAACFNISDDPGFEADLAIARHFDIKSLVLCGRHFDYFDGALGLCGELLWRIESLEMVVDFDRWGTEDISRYGRDGPRGHIHLEPQLLGNPEPRLRHACLPWDALEGCLPLLINTTTLELVISLDDFTIQDILVSLHSLPQSLTHLTFRLAFYSERPPPLRDNLFAATFSPATLPNLTELAILDFESNATNLLLKGIIAPNLLSLAAEPMGAFTNALANQGQRRYLPNSADVEGFVQFDFLHMAHNKFPQLKKLKYASRVQRIRSRTCFLRDLANPAFLKYPKGEHGWLFPKLEALDIPYNWEETLGLVVCLASARRASDKVSSLLSVTFAKADFRTERKEEYVRDVWTDAQINALGYLVSEVKILSTAVEV